MKRFLPSIIPVSFFLLISIQAYNQNYISHEILGQLTKEEIQNQFDYEANYGVVMAKMIYSTPDVRGQLDTASGLIVFPNEVGLNMPSLIYHHGTVAGPMDVPSNLQGGFGLAVAFASQGYFTCAPDFLGLGESRGFHPYVHADSEASASIDMFKASADFSSALELTNDADVYISGYSQGGHAGMATHRELELNAAEHGINVVAAAHLSGPYSIGGVMKDLILGDRIYLFAGYIPNTVMSFQEAYGNIYTELGEIFKPQYVEPITRYYNRAITLGELNTILLGLIGFPDIRPKKMFLDHVLDSVANNPNYPLTIALNDNNVYEWAPQSPTRLFYCTADDQVPFMNAILADSVMNALGAADLVSRDVGPTLDHGGCVEPAALAAMDFFAGFNTLGNRNEVPEIDVKISPNPFASFIHIELEDGTTENNIEMINIDGKRVYNRILNSNRIRIPVGHLAVGQYIIKIKNEKGQFIQKLLKFE